jgi:hypothetical protein
VWCTAWCSRISSHHTGEHAIAERARGVPCRYAEADKKFKQRNAELTEEYRRITKQYKELQLKFRHFDLADQEKFRVRACCVPPHRCHACSCCVSERVVVLP